MFKITIGSIVISLASVSGFYLLNRKPKKVTATPMYKCLFLTEEGIRTEDNKEILFNMLTPIISFINAAETSLDLCFYIISDAAMVNAIIQAKKRNVKIRIVTDYNTGIVNNKYAKYLYKEGILIYAENVDPTQTIMHNKFLIRDNKLLLQASLNLTKNTTRGSYDNVMISDDPYLVQPFKEHFDELVRLFDPDDDEDDVRKK